MRQMRNRTMKSADLATLRALHGRKRWEHIWAYYKLPIIGVLIVCTFSDMPLIGISPKKKLYCTLAL